LGGMRVAVARRKPGLALTAAFDTGERIGSTDEHGYENKSLISVHPCLSVARNEFFTASEGEA
ncbi:MAG: hypothetical protein WBL61_00540, partial [Bryobacteraceae bacterium]